MKIQKKVGEGSNEKNHVCVGVCGGWVMKMKKSVGVGDLRDSTLDKN